MSLALAFLMYITFLWHHIPSTDGSLTHFCRRKIEKRLNQVVRKIVDEAIAREQKARIKQTATGGTGASVSMPTTDFKRQPTLPVLDPNAKIPSAPISRKTTQSDLTPFKAGPESPFGTPLTSPFGARPASPRPSNLSGALHQERTVPDMLAPDHSSRPPSRNTTQSSLHSYPSYTSDAPLMNSAGEMGYDRDRSRPYRNGPPVTGSGRSMSSSKPPPSRSFPGISEGAQRSTSAGPSRISSAQPQPRAGMNGRNHTSTPYLSHRLAHDPAYCDSSPASLASSQRRPPIPTSFSRRPTQEYEMHPSTPTSGKPRPPPTSTGSGSYVPFNTSLQPSPQSMDAIQPYQLPPVDYFGEGHVLRRAGTAPVVHPESYDYSIFDAYGAQEPSQQPALPFGAATAGPGVGGARSNGHGPKAIFNPPRF